ncbi:helix-turn-helix domain-containing protein [Eubacterium sp.]|uniref:helix-turn-helix domain-containing protein n=1 Tax=Eubacterium sp. TaxID=142586 RepID=UPI002FCC76FA
MEPREKLTYSVPEAAEVLGVSPGLVYDLCHSRAFPTIKLGRRLIIPIKEFEEWIGSAGMERWGFGESQEG